MCWALTGTSSNTCATEPSGATSFTYDAAGNELTGLLLSATPIYTYDDLGRTSSVDSDTLEYAGPAQGELITHGTYHYQNNVLGLGRQTSTTSPVELQRDPSTGAAVSQIDGTTKRYLLTDQLGSTIGLLDSSSGGSIARAYTYDPDGNDTTTGSSTSTNIRYAGDKEVRRSSFCRQRGLVSVAGSAPLDRVGCREGRAAPSSRWRGDQGSHRWGPARVRMLRGGQPSPVR